MLQIFEFGDSESSRYFPYLYIPSFKFTLDKFLPQENPVPVSPDRTIYSIFLRMGNFTLIESIF